MTTRKILSLACGLLLAGAAVLPAAAATSYSSSGSNMALSQTHAHGRAIYYVSLTGKPHSCMVVSHTPRHKMMVGTHSYHTHAQAAHAMAAAKICHG